MNLWLKFPPNMKAGKAELLRNHGKRFCYVDQHTQTKDRDHEVRLFPDRPTEVENKLAERLLKQDPHLVSKEQQTDFVPAAPSVMEKRESEIRDYNAPVKFAANANPNVSKPGHPEGFNTIDQAHQEIRAKKVAEATDAAAAEAKAPASKGDAEDVAKFLKAYTEAVADDELKLSTFQAAADTDFALMRIPGIIKILNVFGYQPKNPKIPAAKLKLALNGVLDEYAKTITLETGDLKTELPEDLPGTHTETGGASEMPETVNPVAVQTEPPLIPDVEQTFMGK